MTSSDLVSHSANLSIYHHVITQWSLFPITGGDTCIENVVSPERDPGVRMHQLLVQVRPVKDPCTHWLISFHTTSLEDAPALRYHPPQGMAMQPITPSFHARIAYHSSDCWWILTLNSPVADQPWLYRSFSLRQFFTCFSLLSDPPQSATPASRPFAHWKTNLLADTESGAHKSE